jgi:tetratricopeptide (TPR) repeat protein
VTPGTLDPADLERQGLDAFRKGRLAEAVQRLQMALEGYRARGDSLRTAETSNNLSVVLLKSGEPRQALDAVEGSAAVFEAAGDLLRHAQAIGNEAAALEGVGRLDEAEHHYRQAVDSFRRLGEHEAEAQTWQALAALLLRRGRPVEAASSAQAGLEASRSPGWRRWLRGVLRFLSRFRPA